MVTLPDGNSYSLPDSITSMSAMRSRLPAVRTASAQIIMPSQVKAESSVRNGVSSG